MDQIATSFTHSAASRTNGLQSLQAQAEELEGVFLNTLMAQMFSGLDEKGAAGGGYAQKTWRSMQSEQLAGTIAQNGGIGIAQDILGHLLSAQEQAQLFHSNQTNAQPSPAIGQLS